MSLYGDIKTVVHLFTKLTIVDGISALKLVIIFAYSE